MLSFELVSPVKRLAEAEAVSVTIPGVAGDLTAMENHAPFLTTLRPGFLTVRQSGGEDQYFVTGGFAEISSNTVSVLAEEAVVANDVSAEWIDEQISLAEAAVDSASDENLKLVARQRLMDLQNIRESL